MYVKHLEILIVSREAFKIDFQVYITSSKHKLNNSVLSSNGWARSVHKTLQNGIEFHS